MFVDIIDDFIRLAESFFGILEMEVTAPWDDNMVALMDFKHVCVKPINEVLHFFLSVEGAKCGIIINEIICGVEMRSKTVPIIKD